MPLRPGRAGAELPAERRVGRARRAARLPWGLVAMLALGAWLAAAFPAGAQEVDQALFKKIEANLMCTDGCGMRLSTCDNATAQRMRQQLREQLAGGAGEQEIYAYMVGIYGEEVMAAPPPQVPFNITAWVTPFLALVLGGLALYLALDRWVFNRRREAGEEELAPADLAAYEEVLNREVQKYL